MSKKCTVCGLIVENLSDHLLIHPEFLAAGGDMELLRELTKGSKKRAPLVGDLHSKLMGISLKVDTGTRPEDALKMPRGYKFPTAGKAERWSKRALIALARGRHAFIWGMPGTGKDAIVHAYSALTRRPVVMVTFRPGTDISPWFYTRALTSDGTHWEYGHMWSAITEGVLGRDGERRAPIVLLSDVDRADTAQAEWFRILTDSISGRILDPHGKMVPLFPGVQFICTANSAGSGDSRGRMASSNPMDASILDRLGRKIEAHYLNWSDESSILEAKFPGLAQDFPEIFRARDGSEGQLGRVTSVIRTAIENDEIYGELTHRGLCEILKECQDILFFSKKMWNPLKKGVSAWMDGLDQDSYFVAKRLIDPHLRGGSL